MCNEADSIPHGARLELSIEKGIIEDRDSGESYRCDAIPPHLLAMLNDGGLLGHLAKRLHAKKEKVPQQ